MTEMNDNPPNYPFNDDLEISVIETNDKLTSNADEFLMLDIREPHELEIARIDGAIHIPMGDLPGKLGELDIEEDTCVAILCRTGVRSLNAAVFMQAQGFSGARSIAGGIHWWSDRLDPTLTKY